MWQNICREVQVYEAFFFLARLSLHAYFNSHKNPFTFCRVWSVGVMTQIGEKPKYSKENLSSATQSTSSLTRAYLGIRINLSSKSYMKIQLMFTEITVRVYYTRKHHPATSVQGTNCLGAFSKLRKTTVSVVMCLCLSVRPPVRPHGTTRSLWTNIHEILYLKIFWKSVERIRVSLKADKNNGYFAWRRMYIYDSMSMNSS